MDNWSVSRKEVDMGLIILAYIMFAGGFVVGYRAGLYRLFGPRED